MRTIISVLTLGITSCSWALIPQPMEYRLTYEQYSMPQNIESMGVMGVHGLVDFTKHWYGGFGYYGAVRGESGGYFALSIDGGYQHPLWGPLWIDVGGSVGAGGGRSVPVGGGLFLEPHAGLSWHFKHINLGANYSYVNFTDGSIRSSQVMLQVAVPTVIHYTSFDHFNQPINDKNILFSKNYIAFLGQVYFPNSGTRETDGTLNDSRMEFLGIEYGQFVTRHIFGFANITGAFHGHGNGYSNAFLGMGYQLPLTSNQRLNLNGKLALGSGGGGAVDTGGGFLIQPALGLEYVLGNSFSLEADASYLTALGGNFNNKVFTGALKYYLNGFQPGTRSSYHGWRIRLANQTYFNPKAANGNTNPTMQLLHLSVDYWLSSLWYITGQTAFAYHGQNTGGYFSGMIGPGWQWPSTYRLGIYIEGLVGTAGGAGLDIGSGALGEALVGLNYQLSSAINAQASVGRLVALNGGFNSTVMDVGLGYRFAT